MDILSILPAQQAEQALSKAKEEVWLECDHC